MEKRTVVITGGNSGLGYKCAKNIAVSDKDYTVVIACRNPDKAATATKSVQQETGTPNIYTLVLDLASLESIRGFNNVFCQEKYPPLYSLLMRVRIPCLLSQEGSQRNSAEYVCPRN